MLSVQGSSPYDHNPNHNHSSPAAAIEQQARAGRKRKAETQENDRLSKRLGRLNIAGQNLRKLYATVEDDHPQNHPISPSTQAYPSASAGGSDHMQLDDSKHKVYIYNLDDELTSDDSEPEEGKVVFLPDIERALRTNSIPPVIKANTEGQLAGRNFGDMQLVLYNVPTSLTVAPEHDSVRKAIIEARARARARREGKKVEEDKGYEPPAKQVGDYAASAPTAGAPAMPGDQVGMGGLASGIQQESMPEDVDAMDLS